MISSNLHPDNLNYGNINKSTLKKTFVATADELYIKSYACYNIGTTGSETFTIDELQVEEGVTGTEYTPYVANLSGVEVSRYGKNLFDINTMLSQYSKKKSDERFEGTQSIHPLCNIPVIPNQKYTLSVWISASYSLGTGSLTGAIMDGKNIQYSASSDKLLINAAGGFGTEAVRYHFTFTARSEWITFCSVAMWFDNMQLELDGSVTDYEPYIEPQTTTANADGIVEGLTSLSPNMTVLSNTEGVVINLEYNVDTKMYIDNELAKIKAELSAAIVNS
jgi:hypothetical protein